MRLDAPAESLAFQPHSFALRGTAAPLLEPQQRCTTASATERANGVGPRNDFAQFARPKPADSEVVFENVIDAEKRAFMRVQIQRIAVGIVAGDEKVFAVRSHDVAVAGSFGESSWPSAAARQFPR